MRYFVIATIAFLLAMLTIAFMSGRIAAGEGERKAQARYEILANNTDFLTVVQSESQYRQKERRRP